MVRIKYTEAHKQYYQVYMDATQLSQYNMLDFQLIISAGHSTRKISLCELQQPSLRICKNYFQTTPELSNESSLECV
jgi:hypothetical protein